MRWLYGTIFFIGVLVCGSSSDTAATWQAVLGISLALFAIHSWLVMDAKERIRHEQMMREVEAEEKYVCRNTDMYF